MEWRGGGGDVQALTQRHAEEAVTLNQWRGATRKRRWRPNSDAKAAEEAVTRRLAEAHEGGGHAEAHGGGADTEAHGGGADTEEAKDSPGAVTAAEAELKNDENSRFSNLGQVLWVLGKQRQIFLYIVLVCVDHIRRIL